MEERLIYFVEHYDECVECARHYGDSIQYITKDDDLVQYCIGQQAEWQKIADKWVELARNEMCFIIAD